MRPIKFRARDKNGKMFYGSFDEDTCTIDCWDIAETVVVERDTVAQLVGYDINGNEVYEGDKLRARYGLMQADMSMREIVQYYELATEQ